MAILYLSPDKESRAREALAGRRPSDSSEVKAVVLCSDKQGEEKVLCVYEKLGGAIKHYEEAKQESHEEPAKEAPKKRGRPAKGIE